MASASRTFSRRGSALALALAVGFALFALLAAAAAPGHAAHRAGRADTVKFVMVPANILNLTYAVAADKGFFGRYNINAQRLIVRGGAEALAAIAGGSADLTYATVQQVAQSNEQGLQLRMVVGNIVVNPYVLLVKKSWPSPNGASGYPADVRDLKGARIAVTSRGSDTDLKLRMILAGAGLDPEKDVTIVQAGSDMVNGFVAGQFDALIFVEPVVSTLVADQKLARIVVDLRNGEGPSALQGAAYNGWTTLASSAGSDRIRRASLAIRDAILWMRNPANKNQVIDVMAQEIPNFSRAALEATYDSSVLTYGPYLSPASVGIELNRLNRDVLKSPQGYAQIIAAGGVASQPFTPVGTFRNDVLVGTSKSERIRGYGGDDKIYGFGGNDVLLGDDGNDVIAGGPGNDRLVGGSGADRLDGGPGNDVLDARDGASDVVDCGPGRDVARVDAADRVVNCERVSRK